MLDIFSPKQKSILGIDVSSQSIKILQISFNGTDYITEAYASEILPPKAVEGNEIKDVEAVASCIKTALRNSRFSAKIAVIAVPDAAAINKVLQLNDGLREDEMEEIVIMEADKYIPYPIDEISIDFEVLGTSPKNTELLDVLVVASRSENVNTRAECLIRAGLEPKVVEVESYAIERVVHMMAPEFNAEGVDKVIAVVDFGFHYTHLFVLHNLTMIFSREEEFGGQMLTDIIAQHYQMSQEAALQAQISGDLPDDYHEKVLRPFQDNMVMQVKRTLQFFYSTSRHDSVDHVLLAGGLARQPHLVELMKNQMGVPTSIANPFKYIKCARGVNEEVLIKDGPVLMVACGLALRHVE